MPIGVITRARTVRAVAEVLEKRLLLNASQSPLPLVTNLTLLNASTSQPIEALQNGTLLDLGSTGHLLNIQADLANGAVGSVRFNYDGNPKYRIVNDAPYTLAELGDRKHPDGWIPTVGMHTLAVTPFSGEDGTGQEGLPFILLFNVLDSSTPAAPLRVNAGGPAYTDSSGNAFQADSFFHGGRQIFSNTPIVGTADPALYQTWRQGKHFSLSAALPDDNYAVTLYFADLGEKRTSGSTFDVLANGMALLSNYSIDADAGQFAAVQKTFVVPVTDGELNLAFRGEQGDALISAIAVLPQRVPVSQSPLYVNAGGLAFTDSVGRTFEPAVGFTGGVTSQTPFTVGGTGDGPLFYSFRSGSQFSFSQPVANGDYELWLEFADPTFTSPGQRIFNVSANGNRLLTNYDIVADVGSNQAVAKAFDVQIHNGHLDLTFQGAVGDAIVSSVVLIPKDIPPAAQPLARQEQPDLAKLRYDAQNLALIGLNLIMYANTQVRHGQSFPPDLETLVKSLGFDPDLLASPRTTSLLPRGELSLPEQVGWAQTLDDYIYRGAGKNITVDSTFPLVFDNPDRVSGDINILFGDGHVAEYTRAAAAQILGITIGDPTHAPPSTTPPPADQKVVFSQLNLQVIGYGALLYAETSVRNGQSLPLDMGSIAEFESVDPSFFVNPRSESPPPPTDLAPGAQTASWVDSTTDYFYVGAHKNITIPDTALVAYENPAMMADGINMLLGNFHTEFREMRWAVETILHDRAAYPRSYT